jgi:hypothetical protein
LLTIHSLLGEEVLILKVELNWPNFCYKIDYIYTKIYYFTSNKSKSFNHFSIGSLAAYLIGSDRVISLNNLEPPPEAVDC